MDELSPDQSKKINARPIVWIVGVVFVAFVLTTAVMTFSSLRGLAPGGSVDTVPLADFGEVPAFSLTERSEKPLSRDDLKGQIWIANFIFTYCAGPCPMMTMHMSELQKELAASPNLKLVSFSVDPERDTPERLREYALAYSADPDRWLFLTGDKPTIAMLATDGFHVGVKDDPLLHSTLFALVDKRGHIRNYYHSDDPELKQKVVKDVAILIRDKGV